MRDVIVIGGGAAGLSAAMYALSKQLDVVLIARDLGGKAGWHQQLLGQATPEYIAGEEAVRLFEHRLREQPGCILNDDVVSVAKNNGHFQIETARHGVVESMALIVATGVAPIPLDVPGAEELLGHGLGYSATTHSPMLSGKSVAVIGATERALRGVNEISRVAEKVFLIVPNTAELVTPLGLALQYRANVEMLEGYHVEEISGAFNVEELVISRGHQLRRLPVDAVFVDLGLRPNSRLVRHLAAVELSGLIRVDERNATSLPGLFAAGDVTTTFSEHILIAIGEGARAAMSAHDYLLARAPVASEQA
jgi:thioredoxin reductase (NADPH)